jgi:hypothetical protein
MAYQCPRCGGPVQRGSSTTAGMAGGLVGSLLYAAFGSFRCQKCGPIATKEFPTEVRQKMAIGSLAMIGGAILILGLVVFLIIAVNK